MSERPSHMAVIVTSVALAFAALWNYARLKRPTSNASEVSAASSQAAHSRSQRHNELSRRHNDLNIEVIKLGQHLRSMRTIYPTQPHRYADDEVKFSELLKEMESCAEDLNKIQL